MAPIAPPPAGFICWPPPAPLIVRLQVDRMVVLEVSSRHVEELWKGQYAGVA